MQGFFSNVSPSNSSSLFEHGSNVLWVQLLMAVVSIVGSGSIIVFAIFQNLLRTAEERALFILSVADLMLCFTWLIGAVLLKQTCDNRDACYNLHAVEQMLYMSSFFYTLNYTWVLYKGLKEEYQTGMTARSKVSPEGTSIFSKMATVLSCVLPMLLMVPVLVVGNSNNCSRNLNQSYECLLMHTWEIYTPSGESWEAPPCLQVHIYSVSIFLLTFIITCISAIVDRVDLFGAIVSYMNHAISWRRDHGVSQLSLSTALVLMVKARSLYSRCVRSTSGSLDARGRANLRLLHHQILLYASAFMVCWCPAALLAILFLFNVQKIKLLYFVLYFLQAFTSASQGLFNCLVYGWTQCRLRSLQTMDKRDMDTQTPLLRSQKEKSYATQTE